MLRVAVDIAWLYWWVMEVSYEILYSTLSLYNALDDCYFNDSGVILSPMNV
jgi:hypothetical protein